MISTIVAKGIKELKIVPKMANRHGLVSGATGTGKTVSIQVLAENFSRMGVPVFLADVKGDLSGLSQKGDMSGPVKNRLREMEIDAHTPEAFPVVFWDIFGKKGHPVRTTITEMGPILLSRLLGLNDAQEGAMTIAFRVADDQGLLLLDMKDLRSMLKFIGDNARDFTTEYGRVSKASIGAIQRRLLTLEDQGADKLFGEPALNVDDLMQTDDNGYGVINILSADTLIQHPKTYSTFLLWLLSEIFEQLPEVGDPKKPKLVFFFDEAHLLFEDAPKALLQKIEQVVRLIRSKGVGVYFATQNPADIPDDVLGQLGNRIQHALRAYTPKDRKVVRAAAQTFRQNPEIDTEEAITSLGVGESLISFLDEEGVPSVVEHSLVRPPFSRMGPVNEDERRLIIRRSLVYGFYEEEVDRESAYEILQERAREAARQKELEKKRKEEKKSSRSGGRKRQGMFEAMAKSAVRSFGSSLGRKVFRGVLGSLFGGKKRR